MSKALFIQASLSWPNIRGNRQLILEKINDKPLLYHIIKNILSSKSIDIIYILSSESEIDDEIHNTVKLFSKNDSPKVKCLRFNFNNIILEPILKVEGKRYTVHEMLDIKETFVPLNFIDFLFRLEAQLLFETAYIAQAESVLLLDGYTLDDIIKETKDKLVCFAGRDFMTQLFCLPMQGVKNAANEVKSEMLQNRNAKLAALKNDQVSVENIKAFEELYRFPMEIMRLVVKADYVTNYINYKKISLRLEKNPFFLLESEKDLKFLKDVMPLVLQLKKAASKSDDLGEKLFKTAQTVNERLKNDEEIWCKPKEKPHYEHLILDVNNGESNNRNEQMKVDQFSNVIRENKILTAITYGLRYEPTYNLNLNELIKAANSLNLKKIILKTKNINLEIDRLRSLIECGLNILILDISDIEISAGKSFINNVIELKDQFQNKNKFRFFLQISFSFPKYNIIRELFNSYEFLVNGIIVMPESLNDKRSIDFNPKERNNSKCLWSNNTLYLNSDFKEFLCDRYFDESFDFCDETDKKFNEYRGNYKCCGTCDYKFRSNGFPKTIFNEFIIRHEEAQIDKSDYLVYCLDETFNHIGNEGNSINNYELLEKLREFLKDNILFYEFIQKYDKSILKTVQELIGLKKYVKALNLIEYILKMNPSHKTVHEILDEIESKISKE